MIVGFNFKKVDAERLKMPNGPVDISNNVTIKNIESHDLELKTTKQSGLRFDFEFKTDYKPDLATISLLGEVYYVNDDKAVKEILNGWKKDKKLPEALMPVILNTILNKCNIKALNLSQDINMPAPIKLPHVTIKKDESKKEGSYIG